MATSSDSGSGFREQEGPAFRAPWEAQVFALVCALQDGGKLSPAEWSALLGEEIRLVKERGEPDLGDTYYVHCLAALEKWLSEANFAAHDEIGQRVADWRAAYLKTPHGQPVRLLQQSQGSGG